MRSFGISYFSKNIIQKRNYFQTIERINHINIFFFLLVAGTSCKLSDFISNKYAMTSSERLKSYDVNLPIYEPFYKILFIDSMVPADYVTNLRQSLFQNLKNRKKDQTLFHYGRPLWSALLFNCNSDTNSVLELAKRKLIFSPVGIRLVISFWLHWRYCRCERPSQSVIK